MDSETSEAQVLSVVNQKGGVGKTTTSINLAAFISESGHNTLLIDLDPQANATSGIGMDVNKLIIQYMMQFQI